jgi:hypothetical protein
MKCERNNSSLSMMDAAYQAINLKSQKKLVESRKMDSLLIISRVMIRIIKIFSLKNKKSENI